MPYKLTEVSIGDSTLKISTTQGDYTMAVEQFLSFFLVLDLITVIRGHGRMIEPAARNAAWRYGFDVPANYEDNQQNCGGFAAQWETNNGKCGVCGDQFNSKNAQHVFPGKYAKGVITKIYKAGDVIKVKIDITANHRGWFEFRLGKIERHPVTQEKLSHLLHLAEGGTRWYLTSAESKMYSIDLKLPKHLTCDHCVLQWWWTCGNNWGCDGKKCGLGHGAQETFVNCADICILSSDDSNNGENDNRTTPTPRRQSTTLKERTQFMPSLTTFRAKEVTEKENNVGTKEFLLTNSHPTSWSTLSPSTVQLTSDNCRAIAPWSLQAGMNEWCKKNCRMGYCPATHCICGTSTSVSTANPTAAKAKCRALGLWAGKPAMDDWCVENCERGYCPADLCRCGDSRTTTEKTTVCKAIGRWQGQYSMDTWCLQNCIHGYCPTSHCACVEGKMTTKIPVL